MTYNGVPGIATGSDFDRDRELEPLEASNLRAWAYLSTALEHVQSASTLWADAESRRFAVSSMWTVTRTVLLSYVRAVWLLESDDPQVRVYRSCVLHLEDVLRQSEVSADLRAEVGTLDLLGDGAIERLDEDVETFEWMEKRVKVRMRGLTVPDDVKSEKRYDTTRVKLVARHLDDSEEGLIRTTILSSWRKASGHAHGLIWARASHVEVTARDGPVRMGRLHVDVDGLAMLAQSCALLGTEALRLYDTRRLPQGSAFG